MDSLDRSIMATADNALLAKLATSQAGYYDDPFLECFTRISSTENTPSSSRTAASSTTTTTAWKRMIQPIIKRGTYARICVMDRALSSFLQCYSHVESIQIVVLGAGKDTSYFRLCQRTIMGLETLPKMKSENHCQTVKWYEVDHTSIIQEKAMLIRQSTLLSSFCPNLEETPWGWETTGTLPASDKNNFKTKNSIPSLHLVAYDLRDSPTKLFQMLQLDTSVPTFFLMECVSMYLPQMDSQELLQSLSSSVSDVCIACYEPIVGRKDAHDPFGQMMEHNLTKAGVTSPESCLLQTRTLLDQLDKLIQCGFSHAVGCDMWSAYETILTAAQRKKASQSEFLDEFEEWILIMQHYCFVVASSNPSSPFADVVQNEDEKGNSFLPIGFIPGKCCMISSRRTR